MKKNCIVVLLLVVLSMSVFACTQAEPVPEGPQGASVDYVFTETSGDCEIEIKLDGAEFSKLNLQGKQIPEKNYTINGEKITLQKDYMQNNFKYGKNRLSFDTNKGSADINITVSESGAPEIVGSANNYRYDVNETNVLGAIKTKTPFKIKNVSRKIKKENEPDSAYKEIVSGNWAPSEKGKYILSYTATNYADISTTKEFTLIADEKDPLLIDMCESEQFLNKWIWEWDGQVNNVSDKGIVPVENIGTEKKSAYKIVALSTKDANGKVIPAQFQVKPFSINTTSNKYIEFEVYNPNDTPLKMDCNLHGAPFTYDIATPKNTWVKLYLDLDWYVAAGLTGSSWGFGFRILNETEVDQTCYIRALKLVPREGLTGSADIVLRDSFESENSVNGGTDKFVSAPPNLANGKPVRYSGVTKTSISEIGEATDGKYSMKVSLPAKDEINNGKGYIHIINSPNLGGGKFAPYKTLKVDIKGDVTGLNMFGYAFTKSEEIAGKTGWYTYSIDLTQNTVKQQGMPQPSLNKFNEWLDTSVHYFDKTAEGKIVSGSRFFTEIAFENAATTASDMFIDNLRFVKNENYEPIRGNIVNDFENASEYTLFAGAEASGEIPADSASTEATLTDVKFSHGAKSLKVVSSADGFMLKVNHDLSKDDFKKILKFQFDVFVDTTPGTEYPLFTSGDLGYGNSGKTGEWSTFEFDIDATAIAIGEANDIYSNKFLGMGNYFNISFVNKYSEYKIPAGTVAYIDNFMLFNRLGIEIPDIIAQGKVDPIELVDGKYKFSWERPTDNLLQLATGYYQYVCPVSGDASNMSISTEKFSEGKSCLKVVGSGSSINLAICKSIFKDFPNLTKSSKFTLDVWIDDGDVKEWSGFAFGPFGYVNEKIETGKWQTLTFTIDRAGDAILDYVNLGDVFYLQLSIPTNLAVGSTMYIDNFVVQI